MIEKAKREFAAAIVHVIKIAPFPFDRSTGAKKSTSASISTFTFPQAREIEIDDPLVPRMSRIDFVFGVREDPLVRADIAERFALGKRLAAEIFIDVSSA